ncbi:MAG TPA: cysteine desulfurase NifS, partial [Gemmatimonadaceae bacterium]|nr:cysteine desulfurase NifS [Gemmatimonadaceae bacterium]
RGIAASGGSACQSGAVGGSHVLQAIGVAPDLAAAAIRLSLGRLSTAACVARVAELLPALAAKARSARPVA